ncbi:MAG TPA: hypothetical protein VHY08_13800 [Bacillota bacterium]|nr:hypothetical protein [Bacillota bacterium]
MAVQNLISATLDAEAKTEIMASLERVKQRLNFLLALHPEEVKGLFKAANGYAPFIEKCINAVNSRPEMMSSVFDIEEFKRDFTLIKDLTPILDEVNKLANGLQNTIMAANSDALTEALEVYGAVKLNRNKITGLNVVADDLKVFFQKVSKKSPAPEKVA